MNALFLEALVCVFTLAAAPLWGRAATVRLPNLAEHLGTTETGPLPDAIESQSRWNALGAGCAATAVFVHNILFVLPWLL